MEILTGSELRDYIKASRVYEYRKRDCLNELIEYIEGSNDKKVCALYGLRRTGKTVMMQQAIYLVNDYDHAAYILFDSSDDMYSLRTELGKLTGLKYFYLDEVTLADGFIDGCAFLADFYATQGKKIVMAGTDSLGFILSRADALFDRMHMIHTSYVPFGEFKRLFPDKSIDDYIMYGGVLTDGKTLYQSHRIDEYTNSSITNNILHSFEQWDNERKIGVLSAAYMRGDLPTYINKLIELYNRSFLKETINRPFKSHDLGSVRNLAAQHNIPIEPLRSGEIITKLIQELGLNEPLKGIATEEEICALKKYLEYLDVLYVMPASDSVIFTQPGMRYCQAEALCSALLQSESFSEYTPSERNEVLALVRRDISGRMLEDIVYMDFVHRPEVCDKVGEDKRYFIEKYNAKDGEFDLTVSDTQNKWNTVAIEIKLSDKIAEEQAKHLLSEEFCKTYEKEKKATITDKVVLYTGKTKKAPFGIRYVNVEKLLCSSDPIRTLTRDNGHLDRNAPE